jgi:hypothetical protein
MKIKTSIFFVTLVLLFVGCTPSPTVPSNEQPKVVSPAKTDDLALLSGLKNKNELISAVLKLATASYLESNGFGTMRDFSIDTTHKAFSFSVDLKGESKPLHVAVSKYDLLKDRGMLFFVVRDVSTDKAWINQAAKMFLKEKRIEIPGKYSTLVQLVM